MRRKKKTVTLAKVRRLIRKACDWKKMDNGMPHFWKTEDYVHTRPAPKNDRGFVEGDYPYYTRSSRAIEKIAEQIYNLIKEE